MTRQVWTYYVTRDSIDGQLSEACDLWWIKPTRVRHRNRVTWVATDVQNPGHMSVHKVGDIWKYFRVIPDTDREMLRVDQWATETKNVNTGKA